MAAEHKLVPWLVVVVFQLCIEFCRSEILQTGDKCLKDKDFGEYPSNTYYCKDPDLPSCCEVESEFTCCEEKTGHAVKHQIILWGSVFGVVGLVAFIWVCYRKDTYMCEGETIGKRMKRCCGCEKKVNPEDEKVELSDLTENPDSTHWQEDGTTATQLDPYYDSQVPVTARGVTPVLVKGGGDQRGYLDGNDSDSGRGSTTSIDGGTRGSAHRSSREQQLAGEYGGGSASRASGVLGGEDRDLDRVEQGAQSGTGKGDGTTTSEGATGAESAKEKKKKKKSKKNKKKHLHDVAEEDDGNNGESLA